MKQNITISLDKEVIHKSKILAARRETSISKHTNVLVYAHDADAGKKHLTARELVSQLWERRAGILSTQVLQEFIAK